MSCNGWTTYSLCDIAKYSKEKISIDKVNTLNYISTENMLPEKGGIVEATSIPNSKNVPAFKKGDILISNIRPYFKKIWFADIDGGASTDVLVIKNKNRNKISDEFLYYTLFKDDFFDYVMSGAKGTKMPRGDKNAIMKYQIVVPNIEEQKKIVNLFISLDKKIELNNEMNKTLEEMAQALFKRWFVDFEFPNEEGKPYKSSGGEMVDSKLGMIPRGWNIGTFRDYTERVLGGDWGKAEEQARYTKQVFCLRGADIPEIKKGSMGSMPERYILEKNYENKKLSEGDLVIEISGGSPTQSTGRITYINNTLLSKYNLPIVCTNFCRAISLKNKKCLYFFYMKWLGLYNSDVFFQYENGTTGIKNLDINSFLDKYNIVIPNEEIILKFNEVCKSIFNTIQENGNENNRIVELRDSLLPKLMSGEIRVEDIEASL